jgi:hypothetical protein
MRGHFMPAVPEQSLAEYRRRQPVPSVLLERGLACVKVAAADADDLAGPANVLKLVDQCKHANAGRDELLVGVHGISVVERLKTRQIQLSVRGVTWTPIIAPLSVRRSPAKFT